MARSAVGGDRRVDVAALREAIDARLRGRAAFSAATYTDQPIVFSGRQLRSFVPNELACARALAHDPNMATQSEAYVFWRQASLLADYRDDYEFRGHFSRYYPIYDVMSNDQLRGYFAWRTRWRDGNAAPTETSFIYVHAYELIMGVGVENPQAGFDELVSLRDSYAGANATGGSIATNLGRWADEYIIYWGLDASLLSALGHQRDDAALSVLLKRAEHTDEELADALFQLSAWKLYDSAFYKEYPAQLRRIAAGTYRALADYHDGRLKRSLVETYFGVSTEHDWTPFANAVFFDVRRDEDRTFEISPLDHVHYRGGLWSRDRYRSVLQPNKKLGELMKTIDAICRDMYGFGQPLLAPIKTKHVVRMVRAQAEAELKRKKSVVAIDRSKLAGIRSAAELTCERLIVADETPQELAPQEDIARVDDAPNSLAAIRKVAPTPETVAPTPETVAPTPETVAPTPTASVSCDATNRQIPQAPVAFDEQELELLRTLIDGRMIQDFERQYHVMVSLLIDSINEKLYDHFDDVVIEAADEPYIFDEYVDDVRSMIAR